MAFLAARRLTGRFWAALVAGAVYGFSSYEVGHIVSGQTNLAVIMLLPLMLYLALLWRDGKLGDAVFVGLMAVTMAAEFYIFDEAYAEVAALWAVGLLIGFAVARPADRKTVARLAGLVAIAFGASIVLASPYLVYALRHYPAGFTRRSGQYSLNLLDMVVPRPNRVFWLTSLTHYANSLRGLSNEAYVGIPLLVIVLTLAVLTWSSRLTRLLVILFVLTVALALGPSPIIGTKQTVTLPWAPLWSLPFARNAEPLRFILLGYLVLAIIVAVWLATPVRSRLLLVSRWILGAGDGRGHPRGPPDGSERDVPPASARSAAVRPTTPCRPSSAPACTGTTCAQARSWSSCRTAGTPGCCSRRTRISTCGSPGASLTSRGQQSEACREPVARSGTQPRPGSGSSVAYVHRAGVGAILVERAWAAPWMHVFSRMGLHGTAAGGMIVYRTSGTGTS